MTLRQFEAWARTIGTSVRIRHMKSGFFVVTARNIPPLGEVFAENESLEAALVELQARVESRIASRKKNKP